MDNVQAVTPATSSQRFNVADRLSAVAAAMPDAMAIVCPRRLGNSQFRVRRGPSGTAYSTVTFAELDADATRIARGLAAWGVPSGSRLALLVPPGIEFITLVFALLRAGMILVLIDPGLGIRNFVRCLAEVEPDGFVAVPIAQAARLFLRRKFPRSRWNVTVGRSWYWGQMTLERLRSAEGGSQLPQPPSRAEDNVKCNLESLHDRAVLPLNGAPASLADQPAAIIFTSGSTGPPKGVLYTHRMFDTQVSEIQRTYRIAPGEIDLACFPLFALFNAAMGVTTVLPRMDFSRPASADPASLWRAADDWQVTQAFASPAVWHILSEHCLKTGKRIPTLRRVFSCGAPVPADVLRATLACIANDAQMHTPYGATECLPVANIEAHEVLSNTAHRTVQGAGVCVGRKFDSIDWRIIRITDQPISTINDAHALPAGEIGELIVRGPQTSPRYVTSPDANSHSKISDNDGCWHRMGDVGYLDEQNRFWYCGRKSQRVETKDGPLYTECVEAVFNTHPLVRRTALVGIGPPHRQIPVLIAELQPGSNHAEAKSKLLEAARAHPLATIRHVLIHPRLPVDIRHNAKIRREQLAAWAAAKFPELVGCTHS